MTWNRRTGSTGAGFSRGRLAVNLLAAVLALGVIAAAQALPQQFDYQGRLTDVDGAPVDGPLSMTFRLFAGEEGGDPLWEETQEVGVDSGLFHVILGSDQPLDLDFTSQYWLELEVDGDPMEGRMPLVPVPYAHRATSAEVADSAAFATDADTVGGMTAADLDESEDLTEALEAHEADPAAHHTDTLASLVCLDREIAVFDAVGGLWECGVDEDSQLSEAEVVQHVTAAPIDLAAGSTVGGANLATSPVSVDGQHIEPASIALQGTSTALEDGLLDLGPAVDDELTAEMLQTLTGGGNADALHSHAGNGGVNPTYVGITSTQRTCDVGLAQLNEDCDTEYPGSRLCTDQWILNSFPAPVPGENAYILFVPTAGNSGPVYNVFGMHAQFYVNCPSGTEWTAAPGPFTNSTPVYSGRYYALILQSDGGLTLAGCSAYLNYRSACCAP